MAGPFTPTGLKEIRPLSEPWSVDELDKIPHLHSFAAYIRKILRSNKTFRDIALLNKIDYEHFIQLFNSNFVFYLMVTHQFQLLRELFGEVDSDGKSALYFDEPVQQDYPQEVPVSTKKREIPTPIPPEFYTTPPIFAWNEADPGWSNLRKWQHYESELSRITGIYLKQKINAYQGSIDYNLTLANEVLAQLDENSPEYAEIEALRTRCIKMQSELKGKRFDELLEQEREIGSLQEDIQRMFVHVFEKSDNPVLMAAYQKLIQRQAVLDDQIGKLTDEYQLVSQVLKERIYTCRMEAQQEVEVELQKLTLALDSSNNAGLTETQRETMQTLRQGIAAYRQQSPEISKAEDYQEARSSLTALFRSNASLLPEPQKENVMQVVKKLDTMPSLVEHSVKNSSGNGHQSASDDEDATRRRFEQQRRMRAQVMRVNPDIKEQNPINRFFASFSEQIATLDTQSLSEEELSELNKIKRLVSEGVKNSEASMEDVERLGGELRACTRINFLTDSLLESFEPMREDLLTNITNNDGDSSLFSIR